MTIDLWMPYMLMLLLTHMTLMQGHSGSARPTNQICMLSATTQAISIKLAIMVALFFFFSSLKKNLTLILQTLIYGLTTLFVFLFIASFYPRTCDAVLRAQREGWHHTIMTSEVGVQMPAWQGTHAVCGVCTCRHHCRSDL